MKKLITLCVGLSVAAALVSSASYAAEKAKKGWTRPYGQAGCGLGSVIVGRKGGQIFAATSNSTFYNQFFAITLGTLNCQDNPNNEVAGRMDNFVAANKAALAGDIARGNGEVLENLAVMLDCGDKAEAFGSAMKANFQDIFPTSKVYPNEVTDSIISVIKNDEALAASCKKIS